MSAAAAAGKVALVTGGNKGIGNSIVRALSKRPEIRLTLLGSRDKKRGEEAVEKLKAEGCDRIEAIELDIDSQQSIEAAVKQVKSQHQHLDILVNNAGIAFKGDRLDEEVARTTIATNYYSTQNAIKAFLPIMAPHGRIVNVSSMAGRSSLQKMSEPLRNRMLNAKETKEIDLLLEEFISAVKEGKHTEKGWPSAGYGVSKAGLTMFTRIEGEKVLKDGKGVTINCCCPGWVRTDMAGDKAPKSPDEGAITPVYLATLDDDKISGKFFEDKQLKPFC